MNDAALPEPTPLSVADRLGTFRVLHWGPNEGQAALFLHGLTGVAEVWGPTISGLPPGSRCYAMDQRGHGHSPKPPSGYAIGDYVADVERVIEGLGLAPVDLVGHSMGARVALVLAARRPKLLRSVAIVDIGPEAWKANHEQTVGAIERMPPSFQDVEAALGGGQSRGGESLDAALSGGTRRAIAEARLRTNADGTVSFLADPEALKQSVVSHRSRDFWAEWKRIDVPALLVRGGTSNELREAIVERMRASNGRVRFVQFDGVGHNIPLLAPTRLANELRSFWASTGER